MITIFNRSSVYYGPDLGAFGRIRAMLDTERIPYKYKVSNRMGQWAGPGTLQGCMGSLGTSCQTIYEVFVHKDDYEQAMHLIRKASAPG